MEIITRAMARKNNSLRYFTGKPCINGHVSWRRTSCGKCYECELALHSKKSYIDKRRKRMKEWQATPKEREKSRARSIVHDAIKSGKIKRQPCEKCGKKNSQAHHEDYKFPLKITWLCAMHHKERHREMEGLQ